VRVGELTRTPRPESRWCPALYSAQETMGARVAPRDHRDGPRCAAPAAERLVPANTDQALAPGEYDEPEPDVALRRPTAAAATELLAVVRRHVASPA
jgi:hypothetical protein